MAAKSKKSYRTRLSISTSFRSSLTEQEEIKIGSETEHLLFLLCSEAYRVIDLFDRSLDTMIDTYSKYRTRETFRETLNLRYFDIAPELLAPLDPELCAALLSMFNIVHELRISLLYEDALPYTVKTRLQGSLVVLKREWSDFLNHLDKKQGWKLKAFPPSDLD